MINTVFNSLITFMLANFMLNELPHATGLLGNPTTLGTREQIAASHWNEILKYCHTIDDLKKIASRVGVIKVYHGAPTEFAEIMIREGPRVPYAVEDTARYVAKVYGLRWIEFSPYAYRKHEVREKLSTATAPVAARWAWTFPLGEVLTDLNRQARLVVVAVDIAKREGVRLRDAYERVFEQAEEEAKRKNIQFTSEGAADILGLPDKLALKAKTGALVELEVDAGAIPDFVSHDAKYYLREVETGELPVKEALLFWNHNYMDFRIFPDDIRSMRIVVRDMQPWEQDLIEDMVKKGKLTAYCGYS